MTSVKLPLTLAELQGIQEDCLAEDVAIDLERMQNWSVSEATAFFESGGTDEPAGSVPEEEPLDYDLELAAQLNEAGLGHLLETDLKSKTFPQLVELLQTDRPRFLPTLKELGVAKLTERQKIRDLVVAVANPPAGSGYELRQRHAEQLKLFPWATVEPEMAVKHTDADMMLSERPPPPEGGWRKWVVRAKGGAAIRCRREVGSTVLQGGNFPVQPRGTVLESDGASWAVESADLCVHVLAPDAIMGHGYVVGWASFDDLLPLAADGEPLQQPEVATYQMQRQIQRDFERGYRQLGVQQALRVAMAGAAGRSYREACDAVYLKVRGPALAFLGFKPTNKGLAAFMASRDPATVDPATAEATTSDEDFAAMTNAHNRIVNLMSGQDPRLIIDALELRRRKAAGIAVAEDKVDVVFATGNADLGEEGEGRAAEEGAVAAEAARAAS